MPRHRELFDNQPIADVVALLFQHPQSRRQNSVSLQTLRLDLVAHRADMFGLQRSSDS